MGKEIERKFLVRNSDWKTGGSGVLLTQGYLNSAPERVVRVRHGSAASFLTVKGPNLGAVRAEFEYEIPAEDAQYMLLNLCEKPLLEKTRYTVRLGTAVWEIDEFAGANEGLVTAEIELRDEEQTFESPAWLGEEVTEDVRSFNSTLARRPYRDWK